MNVLLGIIVVLSIFSLIIYLVIKKKIWLIVISGIIIIIIVGIFISASSDKPDKPKTTDKTSTTQQKSRVKRTSAIFKLPADGIIISHDKKGKQKAPYKKGQYLRFEQLTPAGKYICVNKDTPSWSTSKKSCVCGPTTGDGFVKLMSCSGRDMSIRVTVFNK